MATWLQKRVALFSLLSVAGYLVLLHPSLKEIIYGRLRSSQSSMPYNDSDQDRGQAPVNMTQPAQQPQKPLSVATPLKYILYWNEYYGSMQFMWGSGQKPFIEHGCEVNTCFGTNNRTFMKMDKFDAILFHAQTMALFGWPKIRAPHQRYVFVNAESAQYVTVSLNSLKYRDAFNLTLTYRRDSDFPYPYGAMEPVPSPPPTSTRNYAAGKTKLVAWFVSHCSSKSNRGKYVKLLQKHIPVDIYGDCGPLKCPRSADNKCHKTLLNNDYKFYLSFENSICNDYVTEKLFDILKYDVVPVVLGGANYSSFAPPGSYIDALKYTPEQLAKYLLELDKDDAAYNAYFQWKGKYRNIKKDVFQRSSFCDLCKYLHSNQTKVYRGMQNWWVTNQCHTLNL